MVNNLLRVFDKKYIIINTTNSKKDNSLVELIKKNNLLYFRGSEKMFWTDI